jgi:hypothetical protein
MNGACGKQDYPSKENAWTGLAMQADNSCMCKRLVGGPAALSPPDCR